MDPLGWALLTFLGAAIAGAAVWLMRFATPDDFRIERTDGAPAASGDASQKPPRGCDTGFEGAAMTRDSAVSTERAGRRAAAKEHA